MWVIKVFIEGLSVCEDDTQILRHCVGGQLCFEGSSIQLRHYLKVEYVFGETEEALIVGQWATETARRTLHCHKRYIWRQIKDTSEFIRELLKAEKVSFGLKVDSSHNESVCGLNVSDAGVNGSDSWERAETRWLTAILFTDVKLAIDHLSWFLGTVILSIIF